jgi:uncharacterized Rmd1/YagE family protein
MQSQTKVNRRKRCVSFCTAVSYDLTALANAVKRKEYQLTLSRDVLHIKNLKKPYEIFFFNHGCFVCWGLSKRQEQKWVNYVVMFARDTLPIVETDYFAFQYNDDETMIYTHERFKLDIITLESDNPQIKLAISYGLAKSIKLESFEDAIQGTVKKNSALPVEIATHGSIPLSKNAIFKRMGEIFLARSLINLNSEILDTPEFFWRNPNLEHLYIMINKFLDIPIRVSALNQKLDVLQELLDILHSQLQHRHSTFLELIIIILILIEILISLIEFHPFS